MRWLVILVSCGLLLSLVACAPESTTGNVIRSSAPSKLCKVSGFNCYPLTGSGTEVAFSLRSTLDYAIRSGTIQMTTTDCVLEQPTVALDYIPKGGSADVTFRCSGELPNDVSGTLNVTYSTDNGQKGSSTGSLQYHAGSE